MPQAIMLLRHELFSPPYASQLLRVRRDGEEYRAMARIYAAIAGDYAAAIRCRCRCYDAASYATLDAGYLIRFAICCRAVVAALRYDGYALFFDAAAITMLPLRFLLPPSAPYARALRHFDCCYCRRAAGATLMPRCRLRDGEERYLQAPQEMLLIAARQFAAACCLR